MKKAAKKSDVWMPLYIGDYLAGTQRLTCEQHGAYLLLLFDYWRNGPPPADDDVLAQITRLKASAWRKHKPVILGYFRTEGGKLIHARVETERTKAAEHQARRTEKAQQAAEARWHPKGDAPSIAPGMPQAMLVGCPPPSPSSVPKGTGGEPPPDPRKQMWADAVALLMSTGSKEAAARSLIGKWVKDHGADKVGAAVAEAGRQSVPDPKAWITAALNRAANDTDAFFASIDRTYGNGKE